MKIDLFATLFWGALVLWMGAEQAGGAQIRLVNGSTSCSGRLEVYVNGQWGTVCDHGWDMNDAAVVCRQLGCGSALSAPGGAYFGEGTGSIWMDEVQCSSSNCSLTECSHSGFGKQNCSHHEDAGVTCSGGAQIRLVNGSASCSGRVEVYFNGQWGTVCDSAWDMNDAAVVCRQLGCGSALSAPGGAHFGQGTGNSWIHGVYCTGSEDFLTECPYYFDPNVLPHSRDAGVVCSDVDECRENPTICGSNATCSNTTGSFTCECEEGFIPSPGLQWELGVTTCTGVAEGLNTAECETVKTLLTVALDAVESLSQGNGEVGEWERNVGLEITEKLVSALVKPTQNQSSTSVTTEKIEVQTFAIGPEANLTDTPQLKARDNLLKIDLPGIAENNNGSAAVAFMTYTNMEKVLKATLFHTENDTIKTMMSAVFAASLPKTKNTTLPKPVNFTVRHLTVNPKGNLTCVYWNQSRWIVDGCELTETNSTHTVCTCNHLSTFALIMQTDRPPEEDKLLELINTIAVSVGLLFLALAILTFILCRWNPKVNNTARLNLSICLFLAHLLFLLVQSFLSHIHSHELVCAVIAGVLHFLFLSCFVWMFLEALQLFLLVRNLREVRIIQREGIHWGFLLLIGYGAPCLVVGVSAGLVPGGYSSDQCWLKTDKGFRWSFLGPVCYILAVNVILFITIIGHLWFTLASLNKEVSQLKDTRMMLFKALVQFIILGCPWVLGFFVNNNKMLEYLFLLITSQQGTFIFLVHCVLNKEVQEQYRRWWKTLCCSSEASESSHSSRS